MLFRSHALLEVETVHLFRMPLRNALRYFPAEQHAELAPEFAEELRTYGRIYMYRYRPDYLKNTYSKRHLSVRYFSQIGALFLSGYTHCSLTSAFHGII